ncbi:Protein-lysine N-methyltransferase efm4 [Sporothrix stenoceras]|uniref:Protein-lysine N-methyltransferase EFM4 n=1 Tax=Sporothrix stenoceras TaxID=5173 RepID=A0ABR3ZFN2_9PEZI
MPPPKPAHLEPSELGTKDYWDNLYATELANHASNPEDTGTVWFDDADAEAKMVQFLAELDDEDNLNARTILDLGCGNGSLLRAVREEIFADGAPGEEEGTELRLLGVDYSEASISLAQSVVDEGAGDNEDAEEAVPITFTVWDMLQGSASDLVQDGKESACWDLVLDKGTFDAISLGNTTRDGDAENNGPSVEVQYRTQVLNLLKPGGRFLITSCNWTETELCAWMEDEEERERAAQNGGAWLVKAGRVAYPSFQFGGVQGQTVCTVCFEKRVAPAS